MATKAAQAKVEPKAASKRPIPEVRQCRNEDDDQFGAVAVASGNNRWGVMIPLDMATGRGGGHWASDDEVKDWTVL